MGPTHPTSELVALPPQAEADALHVAAAAVHGVDYLLTQNCRHIANARTPPRLYATLDALGLPRPLICTPAEFLETAADAGQPDP